MRHVKRIVLSAATGLATALACAPVASAVAPAGGDGGPKPSQPTEQVLTLTARTTATHTVDVDPPGASQGDEIITTGDLLRSNVTVGRFDEVCTITRVTGTAPNTTNDVECELTLSLSDGQITLQGVYAITSAGPEDFTLAITGGTGRYRTAHGELHANNASTSGGQFVVRLIR